MKKLLSMLLAFCTIMCIASEITITKVQQRYPWNGLVDIEYSISEELNCSLVLKIIDNFDYNSQIIKLIFNKDIILFMIPYCRLVGNKILLFHTDHLMIHHKYNYHYNNSTYNPLIPKYH